MSPKSSSTRGSCTPAGKPGRTSSTLPRTHSQVCWISLVGNSSEGYFQLTSATGGGAVVAFRLDADPSIPDQFFDFQGSLAPGVYSLIAHGLASYELASTAPQAFSHSGWSFQFRVGDSRLEGDPALPEPTAAVLFGVGGALMASIGRISRRS